MIPPSKQPAINVYIDKSFRDTADKDYISARLAYRYRLEQPFMWSALHCIEKYLKAILVYNSRSAKCLGHDILSAYRQVLLIPDISFDFTSDIEKFIAHLNKQGTNRYFEYPYFFHGDELWRLDKTVWHIRRYCWYLRGTTLSPGNKTMELFPLNIKKIQNPDIVKFPHRFSGVPNGYLEKVLADGTEEMREIREQLIYKNFFYGRTREKIKLKPLRSAGNPTTYLHPDIIPHLDSLIVFSKEVRDYFKKKGYL